MTKAVSNELLRVISRHLGSIMKR